MYNGKLIATYAPVVDLDVDDEKDVDKIKQTLNSETRSKVLRLSLVFWTALLCIVLGFSGGFLVKQKIEIYDTQSLTSTACTDPVIRREWRSLSDVEKSDYIAAVQCLRDLPSRLGLNQTLYDDFPYVHSRDGEACE